MTVDTSANRTSQQAFKESVLNDYESLKFGISRASRPSNVDEDGNIIDPNKSKVEEILNDLDYSKPNTNNSKYERGLIDAYNVIKKIIRVNHVDGYSDEELQKIFNETDPMTILSENNIQNIMRFVHEYELYSLENIIFNPGDEFLVSEDGYDEDEYDRLVTLYTEGDKVIGFNSSGKIHEVSKLNCKLTGRNFNNLLEIFEMMDEEDQ